MGVIEKRLSGDAVYAPTQATTSRQFLLLKGPFGPFFNRLAEALQQSGVDVLKVNFDGGDVLDWRHAGRSVGFVSDAGTWAPFVDNLIVRERITDLVVFNDCLELHEIAIRIARHRGVRIHVFEEGYFRPHWITLERDGVNAFSSLARAPAAYREELISGQAPEHPILRPLPRLVRMTILHYLARYLLWPVFRGARSPFSYSAPRQAVSYTGRYLTSRLRAIRAERLQRQVVGWPVYFLALLQRSGDTQMSHHSELDNKSFISKVVTSFARSAPVEARLVFKLHPLEAGLFDYAKIIRKAARDAHVAERVCLIDGGVLNTLARASTGVVVNNSTAGLAAIGFGCPTLTLGRAFYDMPGLTTQTSLDAFWTSPSPPDLQLYRRFRAAVMRQTQINGSFYTPEGWRMAMSAVTDKLLES